MEEEKLKVQSKNAEVIAEGTQIVMQALSTFTGASSNVLKMNKDPKAAPEMAAAPLTAMAPAIAAAPLLDAKAPPPRPPDKPAADKPASKPSAKAPPDELDQPAAASRSLGAADMEEQGPAFCSLGGTDEPEP